MDGGTANDGTILCHERLLPRTACRTLPSKASIAWVLARERRVMSEKGEDASAILTGRTETRR
jgi:hypothetical protein